MLNSIYAPFDTTIHIVLCAIATIFYAYMFISTKKSHYFSLIIAFDLTLLTQLKINSFTFYILAITEAFLVGLIIYSILKCKKKDANANTQTINENSEE